MLLLRHPDGRAADAWLGAILPWRNTRPNNSMQRRALRAAAACWTLDSGDPGLLVNAHDGEARLMVLRAFGDHLPSHGGTRMTMAKADVAEAVRAWCTAFHTRDVQTIAAMEVQAGGFGYRPLPRRAHAATGEVGRIPSMERFFAPE